MVTDFEWWRWIPEHLEIPDDPGGEEPPPGGAPETEYGSWTAAAPLPAVRTFTTAAVLDGIVYVAGGATATGAAGPYFDTLYAYDPASNTWATKAPMPAPRGLFVGAGAIGGRLYFAGGRDTSARNTLYEYDPASNTWATKAPMPPATAHGTSGAVHTVIGGKLYATGGQNSNALYEYDPATNTWATKAPMPGSTAPYRSAVAVRGRIYVVGGSGTPTQLYEYDPAANTWAAKAAIPDGGRYLAAVAASGPRLYVVGGNNGAGTTLDKLLVWDQDTDTWSTRPEALPAPVYENSAARVGRTLYSFGGAVAGATAAVYALEIPADPDEVPDPPPDPEPVLVPGAWELDPGRSAGLISWSITYGRQDFTARVNPTTATVGLAGHYAAPCPVGGDRFRLALSAAVAAELGLTDDERVRFTGEVTDPVIDPRNPVSDVYTITAAGRLGRFRRRTVDGHTWPAEKDGARVTRILAAAGADAESAVDLGTRPLIPPVRKVTAGQLLDQTSDSTGGQLVEQLTGGLDWHSGEHRRGVPVTVTLDAGEILNDLTFEQHVGDILNVLELSYGREDHTVTVRDPGSINQRDIYDGSLSTALANAIDAHDLGLEIVGRRSEPVWQLPNLVVDLARAITSPAKRAQLLALRFGDRLKVTGLPAGAPYAGDVELYVEGTTETATPRGWRLSIAVSDPLLSGVGVRWADVDPALTWDGVDPDLTWLDLARIENPADLTP